MKVLKQKKNGHINLLGCVDMIVMRNRDDVYIFLSKMSDDSTLVAKDSREHYLHIPINEVVKFYVNKGYRMVG